MSKNKKIVLIVSVLALSPVLIGIVGMIITGNLATSSRDKAMNECKSYYKADAEKALEKYKKSNQTYPATLSKLTVNEFPNISDYTSCSDGLNYSSNGSSYTLSVK